MNNLDRINKLKNKAGIEDVVMVRLFFEDGSVKIVSFDEVYDAFCGLLAAVRNKQPISEVAELVEGCVGTDYPYMTDLLRVMVRAFRNYGYDGEDDDGGVINEKQLHNAQ